MVPVGQASLCISSVRSFSKNPETHVVASALLLCLRGNNVKMLCLKKPFQVLQSSSGLAHRVFRLSLSPPLLVNQEEAAGGGEDGLSPPFS